MSTLASQRAVKQIKREYESQTDSDDDDIKMEEATKSKLPKLEKPKSIKPKIKKLTPKKAKIPSKMKSMTKTTPKKGFKPRLFKSIDI